MKWHSNTSKRRQPLRTATTDNGWRRNPFTSLHPQQYHAPKVTCDRSHKTTRARCKMTYTSAVSTPNYYYFVGRCLPPPPSLPTQPAEQSAQCVNMVQETSVTAPASVAVVVPPEMFPPSLDRCVSAAVETGGDCTRTVAAAAPTAGV